MKCIVVEALFAVAAACAVISIFTDLRIRRYRRRDIEPVPWWANYWRLFRPDFYTPEGQSLRRLAAATTIVGSGLLFASVTLIFLWRPQLDADACWLTRGMSAASQPKEHSATASRGAGCGLTGGCSWRALAKASARAGRSGGFASTTQGEIQGAIEGATQGREAGAPANEAQTCLKQYQS